MLATLVAKPFHQQDWVYEEEYDGICILAYKEGAKVRLLSRNDLDRFICRYRNCHRSPSGPNPATRW
jgi:hypothetical protein